MNRHIKVCNRGGVARLSDTISQRSSLMREAIQSEFDPDMRPIQDDELDTVSGGGLFVIGFIAGVIACNVVNDRPWYEF